MRQYKASIHIYILIEIDVLNCKYYNYMYQKGRSIRAAQSLNAIILIIMYSTRFAKLIVLIVANGILDLL